MGDIQQMYKRNFHLQVPGWREYGGREELGFNEFKSRKQPIPVSENMARNIIDHVSIVNGGVLKMWESSMTDKQKSSKYIYIKITNKE